MRYSETAWPGHRSGLTKSSRVITVKEEASEKFHKSLIKIIFPKVFKSALRKRPENLMGKVLCRG